MTTTKRPATEAGTVALIGAGPGDPGLLTVRAVEAIAAADLVVLDREAHRAMLAHASPTVELVDTHADAGDTPLALAARVKEIVAAVKDGRAVVRLVRGDPLGAGPVVEEALALARAGLSVEVVPGVPAAAAVPAYAGIALGSGGGGIAVVDARRLDGSDLAELGAPTLVLTEVAPRLADSVAVLLAAGRPAGTPVALTVAGTTVDQQTLVSNLGQLVTEARSARLLDRPGTSVLVVGDVVSSRDALSWFETRPLFGWRVLVPRTKEQAGALSEQLRRLGAVPEEVPTISVEPPRNPQQVEKAVRGLVEGRYEWIAFTSVNALRAIKEKFEEYGLDARAFSGLKVAAVGEKTAAALRAWGITPDLVPTGEQSAAGLLEVWPEYDEAFDPINRVFLPRADIATENLVAGLHELGWEVDDVTAYRTVRAAPPAPEIRDAIKTGKFDAVVFTSSSTVRNLVGIAGKPHAATVVACIGPQTARTAEEHGLRVDVLAPTPSVEVLVDALAEFGAARRQAMVEAGEPVTRPSQKRRPASKRTAQ